MKNGLTIGGMATTVFLFFLPFVSSQSLFYGATNSKYFYILDFVSLFALYLAYVLFTREHKLVFKNRWLLIGGAVVLIIHYLSSFAGIFPARSLFSDTVRSTGVFFLTYILFFSFWLSEFLNDKDWSFVRRAVAISAAIFSLLTFLGVEGLGISSQFLWINFGVGGLTFGNSTFAGAYLFLAFVITVWEISKTNSLKWKWALWILLLMQFFSPTMFNIKILLGDTNITSVFSSPALVWGTARASSATMMLSVIYLLGWLSWKKVLKNNLAKLRVAWPILFTVAIFAMLVMLFVPGSYLQNKYVEQSTAARILVWNSGFEAVKDKPTLGWGPENFRLAFERHFNNKLYLGENIGEVWFDRAHNLVIDELVSVGIIGLLFDLGLIALMIWLIARAWKKGLIGGLEANILGVLILGHFLQLQTSFDTPATYLLAATIFGYLLYLERKIVSESVAPIPNSYSKVLASGLVVLVLFGSFVLVFKEYNREKALFGIFKAGSQSEQISMINKALSRPSDFESLRMATGSFLKGWLAQISLASDKEKVVTSGREQLNLYISYLGKYVDAHPLDYRARMNYAYYLLVKTAFGEPSTEEAKDIIHQSYELSPGNPLTYALDAVAEMYSGNFAAAKEKINEGLALNPNIDFSKQVLAYINEQEKNLPHVTLLKMENL